MQYVEANWRGHSISWVNITPGIHSGLNPSCREAQIGPKRRRIDKDFDLERNIYLYPVVGGIIWRGIQKPGPCVLRNRAHQLPGDLSDPSAHTNPEPESAIGPSICNFEILEIRYVATRCGHGNPLEIRELRITEATELFSHIQRLIGNRITLLTLLSIRPTGLQHSPLAVAISQRIRK